MLPNGRPPEPEFWVVGGFVMIWFIGMFGFVAVLLFDIAWLVITGEPNCNLIASAPEWEACL